MNFVTFTKEQLSILIRYILNGSVKKMFMDFVPVIRITVSAIAEATQNTASYDISWRLS